MRGHEIKRIVGEYYRVDMNAKSRERSLSRPRQMAMFLCRKHTKLSWSQIASVFGGLNHTTVIHGVRQVEKKANNLQWDIIAIEQYIIGDSLSVTQGVRRCSRKQ